MCSRDAWLDWLHFWPLQTSDTHSYLKLAGCDVFEIADITLRLPAGRHATSASAYIGAQSLAIWQAANLGNRRSGGGRCSLISSEAIVNASICRHFVTSILANLSIMICIDLANLFIMICIPRSYCPQGYAISQSADYSIRCFWGL